MRRLAQWLVLSSLICGACGGDGKSNMDSSLVTAGAGGVGPGGVSGGPEDTGGAQPVMAIEERLPGAFACAPESGLRDLGESDGDVTRLLPVDINKDGVDDLLIGSMSDGGSSNPLDGYGVRLLLSGTSGFTLSSELGMPCGGGASECGLDMVVEDHDKDGNLDVLAVSPTWRKLMVYLGDGEGNFSQLGDDLEIEVNPADYHFIDVDIDGDSDLVATMAQGCEEDQATVSAADYCVGSNPCPGDLVCRHSFLGGGSDLCLPRPCAGFQVLENQGGGSFSLGVLQTISMDAVGQPQVGDVNGDGVLDGYVVSPDVRWYRASGASFEPAAAVVLHGFRYSKAFDIDNDGRDELIVGGYVLWSDANGHFTRATQHSFQTNSERLAAFRIDDTHTLVASNGEVGEQWTVGVSIFEGTQLKKHFDLCATIVSSDAIGAVAAADIDGDGTRELVVGGLKKDMLQVYDGAFSD